MKIFFQNIFFMEKSTSYLLAETRNKLGINKSEMARRLDVASQLYGQYERGDVEPKLDFKQKFKRVFGVDLIEDEEKFSKIGVGIPLIPIEAMAGFGTGEVQVMNYETETYRVPEFTELKVDFMIRVKGSSMYPKYSSGDLVACKKLPLNDLFFQWNKVYVLDTNQGAIIKRIKPSKKTDHIALVSENEKYDTFELHLSKVNAVALVVGVIRLE